MEKVRPIAVTDPIPNDTVSVRRGLDPAVVDKVRRGLIKLSEGDQGQKMLRDLYNINGLTQASDKDYDTVRAAARALNLDLEEQIKPRA
jgi:phosphonate transport system substrate-binding protein